MSRRLFRTNSGQVIKEVFENVFLVEFGNIFWKLTSFQFKVLRQFVMSIDEKEFEEKNANTLYERKIRIPVNGTNMSIMLSTKELIELRELLFGMPDDLLYDNQVFEELFRISENSYDRLEKRDSVKIIRISCDDISNN